MKLPFGLGKKRVVQAAAEAPTQAHRGVLGLGHSPIVETDELKQVLAGNGAVEPRKPFVATNQELHPDLEKVLGRKGPEF